MPSESQHRNKAERNRRFLNSISREDLPEWVAVAAFYTAVHLVERVRAAAGHGDSTSHEDRLLYVQHNLPDEVHTAHHILQNVSMLARYQSAADFFAQFQPDDVEARPVGGCLGVIEGYVAGRLPGPAGG